MIRKWLGLTFMFTLLAVTPVWAEEATAEVEKAGLSALIWLVVTAGFGLAVASAAGAFSQSRALISAFEGISRNPGSADSIRGLLIIGLAFIESLVIYVLLIDFILLFGTIGQIPIGE